MWVCVRMRLRKGGGGGGVRRAGGRRGVGGGVGGWGGGSRAPLRQAQGCGGWGWGGGGRVGTHACLSGNAAGRRFVVCVYMNGLGMKVTQERVGVWGVVFSGGGWGWGEEGGGRGLGGEGVKLYARDPVQRCGRLAFPAPTVSGCADGGEGRP